MKLRDLNNFCIYKITNLMNGKVYIGKTSNIEKRWKRHISVAKNKERKAYQYLHKSINKYGVYNFNIEVLENCLTEIEAFEKEKKWIEKFNSNDYNFGMNLTDGGEGTSGVKWSEESRDKIRGENNHNYGKKISDDIKSKISKSVSGENNGFYGKTHSEEVVNFLKNREISEELKKVISCKCRGSNQSSAKLTEKDVLDIRDKWNSGKYSQTELAKLYNVKPNTINQIVNRKRWTHI